MIIADKFPSSDKFPTKKKKNTTADKSSLQKFHIPTPNLNARLNVSGSKLLTTHIFIPKLPRSLNPFFFYIRYKYNYSFIFLRFSSW